MHLLTLTTSLALLNLFRSISATDNDPFGDEGLWGPSISQSGKNQPRGNTPSSAARGGLAQGTNHQVQPGASSAQAASFWTGLQAGVQGARDATKGGDPSAQLKLISWKSDSYDPPDYNPQVVLALQAPQKEELIFNAQLGGSLPVISDTWTGPIVAPLDRQFKGTEITSTEGLISPEDARAVALKTQGLGGHGNVSPEVYGVMRPVRDSDGQVSASRFWWVFQNEYNPHRLYLDGLTGEKIVQKAQNGYLKFGAFPDVIDRDATIAASDGSAIKGSSSAAGGSSSIAGALSSTAGGSSPMAGGSSSAAPGVGSSSMAGGPPSAAGGSSFAASGLRSSSASASGGSANSAGNGGTLKIRNSENFVARSFSG